MQIIGVAAMAQNGKDTAANYLAKKLGFNRSAFALAVKNVFCESFDVDMQFIEEWKVKNECPPGFDMPVRKALQFIGDGFRQIRSNIWVEIALRGIQDKTCISDCRYPNELQQIFERDGVNIVLYRPDYENNDTNKSEAYIRKVANRLLENGKEGVVDHRDFAGGWGWGGAEEEEVMMGITATNIFLLNDTDVDSFYNKLDEIVIPYLRDVKKWDI
jgi:hypothetical protein